MYDTISKAVSRKKQQSSFFAGHNLALKTIKEKIEKLKTDYTIMGLCLAYEDESFVEKYKAKIDVCKVVLSIIENEKI